MLVACMKVAFKVIELNLNVITTIYKNTPHLIESNHGQYILLYKYFVIIHFYVFGKLLIIYFILFIYYNGLTWPKTAHHIF